MASWLERRRTGVPFRQNLAAVELRHAEQSERQLGAPGAQQSRDAEHLAGMKRQADILEFAGRPASRSFEDRLARFEAPRPHRVLDAASRHQLGQAMIVDLGCGKGADLAPVAQHGDALGDLDHFLQPMTDEHDRHAQFLQAADDRQQQVDLMPRQRRCRLVHEQQARVGSQARGRSQRSGAARPTGCRPAHRAAGAHRAARARPAQSRAWPARGGAVSALPSSWSIAMFSSTVRLGNSDRSWKMTWMPSAFAWCGVKLLMGHAVDRDRAAWIGRMDAGEDLDEGRFAGAVLSDQAVDFARLDRPVDRVEGDGAAEALSDAGKRQERIRAGLWNVKRQPSFEPGLIRVPARGRLRRTRRGPMRNRRPAGSDHLSQLVDRSGD